MTIAIRRATREDLPLIARLIRALAEYEGLSDQVRMREADLDEHLFGERPAAEVLVVEVGKRACGFALFFHSFSTFEGKPGLWIEDLFVVPKARRLGLGTALFGELARIALERGCARLDWAVLDWNKPAIGFYRSVGAFPLDEWTTMRLTGEALQGLADAAPRFAE